MDFPALLAQQRVQQQPDLGPAMAIAGCFMVFWLILAVLMIASLWVIFTKADKPGWAAIIPIYNTIVMLEIAGKPIWWVLLFFIPFVNIVIAILALVALAERFGKGAGYAIGLIFLPFIFFPMLAFGSARYRAPAGDYDDDDDYDRPARSPARRPVR